MKEYHSPVAMPNVFVENKISVGSEQTYAFQIINPVYHVGVIEYSDRYVVTRSANRNSYPTLIAEYWKDYDPEMAFLYACEEARSCAKYSEAV